MSRVAMLASLATLPKRAPLRRGIPRKIAKGAKVARYRGLEAWAPQKWR
jgi:hypothetical protein